MHNSLFAGQELFLSFEKCCDFCNSVRDFPACRKASFVAILGERVGRVGAESLVGM